MEKVKMKLIGSNDKAIEITLGGQVDRDNKKNDLIFSSLVCSLQFGKYEVMSCLTRSLITSTVFFLLLSIQYIIL